MRKTQCVLPLLAAALLAAGCSPSPRALPLTDQVIDAALTPLAMDVLRVQARSIRHPLLAPLEMRQDEGVSPDEAAVLAVLANPSLRAVRDERGLAAAQVLQAGLLPNPSVSWGNEFPYAGPDNIVAYSVGVSWDISALVSHGAKLDAAKAQAASVDLDIAWQEWQVAQSAKSAAWKVLSLQRNWRWPARPTACSRRTSRRSRRPWTSSTRCPWTCPPPRPPSRKRTRPCWTWSGTWTHSG